MKCKYRIEIEMPDLVVAREVLHEARLNRELDNCYMGISWPSDGKPRIACDVDGGDLIIRFMKFTTAQAEAKGA